jgi:hypothetical protein
MKTEWIFPWRAHDFRFSKVHRFVGTFEDLVDGAKGPAAGMEAHIRIEADADRPSDRSVEQTGSMYSEIPLPPESAEQVAYAAASNIGEQISFRNGDFRVHYGLVTCRRIPESPEEESEIDGKPYSVRISLVEVVAPPEFDGSRLTAVGGGNLSLDLLAQFNETRRDDSPIRKFLGFFRILESLSHGRNTHRGSLKRALRDFVLLKHNYRALIHDGDFDSFVGELVDTRHRCAHLKAETGFGYVPHDPAVHREVVPQLSLLEELTYRCVEGFVP